MRPGSSAMRPKNAVSPATVSVAVVWARLTSAAVEDERGLSAAGVLW